MATSSQIVQEVLAGKWGNGEERKKNLKKAGYSWIEIQSLINIKFGEKHVSATPEEIANEILEGRWGNGLERKQRITAAGFDYGTIQAIVNKKVANKSSSSSNSTSNKTSKATVGSTVTAKGIDISAWQGNVDFFKVKGSGIQFAIFREGFGTTIDNKFIEYVKGAKSANLPIHGVYHFCYSINTSQVLEEAKACVSHVRSAGLDKTTIIFFDFEYDTVAKAKNQGVTLGKKECIAFTNTFCQYVISQGFRAGVYSNLDYYNTMYDTDTLNKYIYWVAHYNGGGAPLRKGAYHQWSDRGVVNGINGNVDMDNCYISAATTTSSSSSSTKPTTSSGSAQTITTNFAQYQNKISNCGKDENSSYRGGQAGDQTGKEWWIINWYNQNWQCVLRHPNQKVREYLAELAIQAANNNKVGYDQAENQSYWNQLRSVGYWPKNIKTACEADCSSGIIANTKAVGYLLGIPALQNINATYTKNMRAGYKAAGFEVLTDKKYLTSSDYLLPGDIILNDDQHATTNLGQGKNAQNTNKETSTYQLPAVISKEVKFIGTVTASQLYFRVNAGTSYGTITKYPLLQKGTKVKVCDTVIGADKQNWYYINYNDVYGFVAAQYISKG